jgi:hypothetical protein
MGFGSPANLIKEERKGRRRKIKVRTFKIIGTKSFKYIKRGHNKRGKQDEKIKRVANWEFEMRMILDTITLFH